MGGPPLQPRPQKCAKLACGSCPAAGEVGALLQQPTAVWAKLQDLLGEQDPPGAGLRGGTVSLSKWYEHKNQLFVEEGSVLQPITRRKE